MPKVVPLLYAGNPVVGLWKKTPTQGDAYKFITAEAGHAQLIHKDDPGALTDGRPRVTAGADYLEFVLGFRYLVGLNQIEVKGVVDHQSGLLYSIPNKTVVDAAKVTWPGWPPTQMSPIKIVYFQEIGPDTIRVYNIGNLKIFQFSVPFTSLQATSRARVVVSSQGDNTAIECLGIGDGILLKSRNGSRGLLRIDDGLNLKVDPK